MDQTTQNAAPVQAPAPVAGKKPLWLKVLLGAIIAFAAIFVMVFTIAYAATAKPAAVAKEFTGYISEGNIGKAYNLTSDEFRKATTQAELEEFLKQYPILRNAPAPSFNDRSVENGMATISGTVTGQKGEKSPINVYLVTVGDEWMVLSLDLQPKKQD